MSLAEVRMRPTAALPHPVLDLPATLELLAYQRTRQAAAYRSLRKRALTPLNHRRELHVSL